MKEELKYIQSLLPLSYRCEERSNGVYCESGIGIKDDNIWNLLVYTIRNKFKDQFMEVNHLTSTNHRRFIVYLRPFESTFKRIK